MKKLSFLILLLFLLLVKAEAIDISTTGGWTQTINASNLVSGAGSNLTDTYESVTTATLLTISNTIDKNDNWRVDVKRTDSTWHGNFTLSVKRTTNGVGPGSVSGGLSYIAIQTTDSQFFSGAGNKNNINLQYQLTGMSVSVAPQTYSTTITYTVVDTP